MTEQNKNTNGLSQSINSHLERFFKAHKTMAPQQGVYYRLLKELEEPLLRQTMAYTKGNQIKASKILGLNRNTLRTKLKMYNIEASEFEINE